MNQQEQAQIARLHTVLERRKASLLSQMEDNASAADAGAVNEIETSPADNASLRTLNELVNEAAGHHAEQLRLVMHALAKFADGSYGICDSCGEAIGLLRLTARPEANFCIACQTRMEKLRR
ncbi:DnaK suppressor protein [Oxalobacteraceae bacterium GrIS 1.11]